MTATIERPTSSPTTSPSSALVVAAIVGLALNLRLSVNSLGAALPQIRDELRLPAATAGVLNALPELIFAVGGIIAPSVAARAGRNRLIAAALAAATVGQVIRIAGNAPTALFCGTALTLVAPAVGNVLLPGLIREHFPHRVAAFTGLTIMLLSLGAALGSGATIPLAHALDGSWRVSFLVWALVTTVAFVPWLRLASTCRSVVSPAALRSEVPLGSLVRHGLPWAMAGFFALQAAQVYVAIGWLGEVFSDRGVSDVKMGTLLAVAPVLGVSLALTVPLVIRRQQRIGPLMVAFGAAYLVAYAGMLVAPVGGAWVWMMCIGLGGGTFPAVLSLVAMRAASTDGVIALSAFTQSIGYLFGSLGPLAFGVAHDLGGGWAAPLTLMAMATLPMVAVGRRLARPRLLEDELARPHGRGNGSTARFARPCDWRSGGMGAAMAAPPDLRADATQQLPPDPDPCQRWSRPSR